VLRSYNSDAKRSEEVGRWVLGSNRLDPSGASVSSSPLWGNAFAIPSGFSSSLVAVAIAPATSGVTIQLVRVTKLFCKISEGDTPATPTLTSTSLPGFVAAGDGFMALTYPMQTWTTTVPTTTSTLSGVTIGFPTVTLATTGATNITPTASYALPSYQLMAGAIACSFPITSGFRLDGVGNLQVGSTSPFTPVVWNPTTGTTGLISLVPTANVTPPLWQLGVVTFNQTAYTATVSGGWTTVPSSTQITTEPSFRVSGVFTGDSYSGSGSLVMSSMVVPNRVQINVSVYIARYNVGTALYSVKDPLRNPVDVAYDYLKLVVDNYIPAFGSGSSDTGRLWEVDLPHPVVLEAGEALLITVSQFNSLGAIRTFVPYIRAEISDVV